MNLWRIQNLLTKVPNIIRRSQTRKVLQENWVTRVFHQHQSLRDLRQAPIAGVLWPSDSVTNEFRCALRSVPSHNLVNLTTYTGDVGKTAGFLRCPSTFRIDSGQNSRLPSASQPAEVRRLPASTDNPEQGLLTRGYHSFVQVQVMMWTYCSWANHKQDQDWSRNANVVLSVGWPFTLWYLAGEKDIKLFFSWKIPSATAETLSCKCSGFCLW